MAVTARIAFQGGGARLADLLPIVAAIQKAVVAREISVTHVSGTSAGAIAAALLATDTNARQFVTQVTTMRKQITKRLLGSRLTRWFHTSKAGILSSLLTGQPISSKKALKSVLLDIFQKANPQAGLTLDTRLSQLPIDGFWATVTDITSCRGTHFSKASTPDDKLFDVLTNSCAVPFFFKSLRDLKENPPDCYVDGGVIQNFPIDNLISDRTSVSDMILGFGFSDDYTELPIGKAWDYAGRILSASMQSSMEYAKRKVGEDRVFEIKSVLDTFEFDQGIDQTLDAAHFEKKFDEAYEWISMKISTSRTSYERVTLSTVLERVKDTYKSFVSEEHQQDRSNLIRVVKIDSMFSPQNPRYSASDRSYTQYDISFDDRSMNAIRIANPLDTLKYEFNESLVAVPEPRIVLAEDGKDIKFISVPSRGITRENSLDHIVFFHGRSRTRRTVSIKQKAFIFNGLTGLHPDRGACDHFVIRNQGLDCFERARMLFYVPKHIVVRGTNAQGQAVRIPTVLQVSDISLKPKEDIDRKEGEQLAGPGEQLSDAELAQIALPSERGDSSFIRVGWSIPSLPASSAFGLQLSLPGFQRDREA